MNAMLSVPDLWLPIILSAVAVFFAGALAWIARYLLPPGAYHWIRLFESGIRQGSRHGHARAVAREASG